MNNNEISNLKVEVPQGLSLNDKDYLNCLLTSLKELEKNYAIVLSECSNEHLFGIYKNIFDSVVALQRECYELAFINGWYKLERAESQKVDQKYQCLDEEYKALGI